MPAFKEFPIMSVVQPAYHCEPKGGHGSFLPSGRRRFSCVLVLATSRGSRQVGVRGRVFGGGDCSSSGRHTFGRIRNCYNRRDQQTPLDNDDTASCCLGGHRASSAARIGSAWASHVR